MKKDIYRLEVNLYAKYLRIKSIVSDKMQGKYEKEQRHKIKRDNG